MTLLSTLNTLLRQTRDSSKSKVLFEVTKNPSSRKRLATQEAKPPNCVLYAATSLKSCK